MMAKKGKKTKNAFKENSPAQVKRKEKPIIKRHSECKNLKLLNSLEKTNKSVGKQRKNKLHV